MEKWMLTWKYQREKQVEVMNSPAETDPKKNDTSHGPSSINFNNTYMGRMTPAPDTQVLAINSQPHFSFFFKCDKT